MAEHPVLIKRLFLTNYYCEEGIYKIKICKGGVWIHVVIDDYFPCSIEGGPFFSRNMIGNELWVLLLEKAYAKVHGNYFTLRGGYASEAFTDLTGCPTECWYFDDEISQQMISDGKFFQMMLNVKKQGCLLSVSTEGENMWNESSGNDSKSGIMESGFMEGRAYAILEVQRTKEGDQLIKLRNPWGNFKWNGDWSE
jgi:calpain-15